ncbi:MAG: hypothetical protein ACI9DC_000815 [Gammaproteobacteria bacterium]|jgi:hypothetical protein
MPEWHGGIDYDAAVRLIEAATVIGDGPLFLTAQPG